MLPLAAAECKFKSLYAVTMPSRAPCLESADVDAEPPPRDEDDSDDANDELLRGGVGDEVISRVLFALERGP